MAHSTLRTASRVLKPAPFTASTFPKWLVLVLLITHLQSSLRPVNALPLAAAQGHRPTLADAVAICFGISAAQEDLPLYPGDTCIQDILNGQGRQNIAQPAPAVQVPRPVSTTPQPPQTPRPSKTPKPSKSSKPSAAPATTLAGATTNPPSGCGCTLQDVIFSKCNAISTTPDPCNGAINGTAVNLEEQPFCTQIAGSSETTFVYDHPCIRYGVLRPGCESSDDCLPGEVCVPTPNACLQPVCAVVANTSNCNHEFNCGAKKTCPAYFNTTAPVAAPPSTTPTPTGPILSPCNCTVQQASATGCITTTLATHPCIGNISGTAIDTASVGQPFCIAVAGTNLSTFIYNHLCTSTNPVQEQFFQTQYACNTTADCVDGEICTGATNCGQVCAVVANESNCGKTFNCGRKDTCPNGQTTVPGTTSSPPPPNLLNVTRVATPSAIQAGLSSLKEYFYGDGGISNSIVQIDGEPFFTTYTADAVTYNSNNYSALSVMQQASGFPFNLTVSIQGAISSTSQAPSRRRLQGVGYPTVLPDMRNCTSTPFTMTLLQANGSGVTQPAVTALTGRVANYLEPLTPVANNNNGTFTGVQSVCYPGFTQSQCELVLQDRHSYCTSWAWWAVDNLPVACGDVDLDACDAIVQQAADKDAAQCKVWQKFYGDGSQASILAGCSAVAAGKAGRRLLQEFVEEVELYGPIEDLEAEEEECAFGRRRLLDSIDPCGGASGDDPGRNPFVKNNFDSKSGGGGGDQQQEGATSYNSFDKITTSGTYEPKPVPQPKCPPCPKTGGLADLFCGIGYLLCIFVEGLGLG